MNTVISTVLHVKRSVLPAVDLYIQQEGWKPWRQHVHTPCHGYTPEYPATQTHTHPCFSITCTATLYTIIYCTGFGSSLYSNINDILDVTFKAPVFSRPILPNTAVQLVKVKEILWHNYPQNTRYSVASRRCCIN